MANQKFRVLRIVILLLLIVFVAIQFIRPGIDNPPVTADFKAPAAVKAILQKACYDCHSNETRLLWFDEVAPASWLVAKDVREGRKVLNFSRLDSLPKGVQAARFFESIFQIEQGAMPLSQYAMLHHDARISAAEMDVLKAYARELAYKPSPDTARDRAWGGQYADWIKSGGTPVEVKDEYNGMKYAGLAGFSDWQAVSTTERYDNGTLRLILGNEVVVKAIREGHTSPWPDGAVFAKVAWDQRIDSSGVIRPGAFKQVEFMVKDAQQYSSTFGWNWGRWVGGLSLKPYGKDAAYVTECLNCHRPLDKTDHTFTFPLKDTLDQFENTMVVGDSSLSHPLARKVITTMVDPQAGTMSTLYGNDIAVKDARHGAAYEAGAVIWLVTWSQKEDPHWFGGRIPHELRTIETLTFSSAGASKYAIYNGKGQGGDSTAGQAGRHDIGYLTSLKASVMP